MEAKSNAWAATTRKHVRLLAYWTWGWVITLALAVFGPKFIWNYNSLISVFVILINTVVGIGMILMNRKYINGLDELYRKINVDAMAIALGVGIVGGMSYSSLDVVNVISFDAEISFVVMLMAITYFIAIVVGYSRYK